VRECWSARRTGSGSRKRLHAMVRRTAVSRLQMRGRRTKWGHERQTDHGASLSSTRPPPPKDTQSYLTRCPTDTNMGFGALATLRTAAPLHTMRPGNVVTGAHEKFGRSKGQGPWLLCTHQHSKHTTRCPTRPPTETTVPHASAQPLPCLLRCKEMGFSSIKAQMDT